MEERKADHIRISLEEDVEPMEVSSGFDRYRFEHQALPELGLSEIDLSTSFLGKPLSAPLLISSMTGGVEEALSINRNLARAAQEHGIAMGLGSLRAALEEPRLATTYQVRDQAPDLLLLANLGAVQLNYGYGVDECRRAVEMVEADGLILHLNPLQEAVQPEGNSDFSGLLPKIARVCKALEVPVIVKEVGWGISRRVARMLADAGVAAIDVAGAGGTSWTEVERHRARTATARSVAAAFSGWGIPTAESLLEVRASAPDLEAIASGGIRNGIDIAKALALGARVVGLAGPFLAAATVSQEAVGEAITEYLTTLRVAMFGIGARDLESLRDTPHLVPLGPLS